MTRLDNYLVYAESHRLIVCCIAAVMVMLIAWGDWVVPNTSLGFLYLIPILLAAPALRGSQIFAMALVCGYLREAFDPLQGDVGRGGAYVPMVLNPLHWVEGSFPRLVVAASGVTAMSSWLTSGCPPIARPKARRWRPWCGTLRRTCATAKAPGSIP